MTDLELAEEIERQTKDRDAADIVLELDQWQQIIAALRRGPERPPLGEMVMVPRETGGWIVPVVADWLDRWGEIARYRPADLWDRLLSAAEASKEAK